VTSLQVQPERSPVKVAHWPDVADRVPVGVTVDGIDLVIIRRGTEHSVLFGRCKHRGALLADGHVDGDNLLCGLHGWDYRIDTGVSAYNNAEVLEKFTSWLDGDDLLVDLLEVRSFKMRHPQPFDPDVYQGAYKDPHLAPEEPFVGTIHELAAHGLTRTGHHGPVGAMGVSRDALPSWDHLQFVTAQLATLPRLDDEPVSTDVCIGPGAARPLHLDIPIFVSDMSFGALSAEAKIALARADRAGTGICSGEAACCPRSRPRTSVTSTSLASGRFGWSFDVLDRVQAFHFKGGQGAKTGTGGHLPGDKVQGRIAEVRHLAPGTPAVSPARFPDWTSLDDYRRFADEVRERSGGIPIGFKLSAQHIEQDIDAALTVGVDYIILDGRGGGTGAAPLVFRDTSPCPRCRRWPGPGRTSTGGAAATSRSSSPAVCARHPTSPRPWRSAPTRWRWPTPPSRPSGAWGCGPATRTTARWGSPPSNRTFGPGCRSRRPPPGSTGSCGPASSSWRCSPGRAATIASTSSASTTSPPSTATSRT
jgi:nitrite reductase/ring-hydroxylating ferredoxin subunit